MKCCDITPGMLRHLVDFQQQAKVADGGGGNTLSWLPVAIAVPSQLKPRSASEQVFAKRIETNITHTLLTRFRPDLTLTTDDRVLYQGRPMQIRGIINIEERSIWWQMMLEEGPLT